MTNCSDKVSDEEKSLILSKFLNTLRISGYDQLYRFQNLKRILVRQKQIDDEKALGNRVKYRSQSETKENRKIL